MPMPSFDLQSGFTLPFQPATQPLLAQSMPTQQNPELFPQNQQYQQPINLQQSLIQSAPFMLPSYMPTPQYFFEHLQSFQQPPPFSQYGYPIIQQGNPFMQPQQMFAPALMNQMQQTKDFQKQQNSQTSKMKQECPDFNWGFCINGPNCQYIHVKKPENQRPKKVPEWYIQKVSQHFQNNGMTNQVILLEILNSVLINKLQDTQSINFSFGGTFSDVMSERSDHYARRDAQMQIETTRPIIKGRTRFFIVKSYNMESILTSILHGVWATTPGPTKKLTNAFKTSDHVILIFSVNESRCIQGFALMESEPTQNLKSEVFTSDENSVIQYSDNFKVRWIISCDFQFKDLDHLPFNPMNENLPIKQSKNGQELPFKLGNYLCYLLYNSNDPKKRIICPLDRINEEFKVSSNNNFSDGSQHPYSQHYNQQTQHYEQQATTTGQNFYQKKQYNTNGGSRPKQQYSSQQQQQQYIIKQNYQ